MKTGAFFDLDDTIIRGNSGMRVAVHYFFSGKIGWVKSAKIVFKYFRYFLGQGDPYRFFSDVYDFLKGKRYEDEKAYYFIDHCYLGVLFCLSPICNSGISRGGGASGFKK